MPNKKYNESFVFQDVNDSPIAYSKFVCFFKTSAERFRDYGVKISDKPIYFSYDSFCNGFINFFKVLDCMRGLYDISQNVS